MKPTRLETVRSLPASLRASGPVGLLAGVLLPMAAVAGPNYTEWSGTVPVMTTEGILMAGCPIESKDGLSLYTASGRPGGIGALDIYVNNRESQSDIFGPSINLGMPVNSEYSDFCPSPLRGNYLLFVSTRPGGCDPTDSGTTGDIYIIRNKPATGWGEPRHQGCVADGTGPNTAGAEFSPSLVETDSGTFLFFSSDGYTGNQDIVMSERLSDGSFSAATAVNELNTADDDRMPTVRKDGLEIVFSSNRSSWGGGQPAAGSQDVYTSSRAAVGAPWSDPVNLSVTADFPTKEISETRASFSWDATRLYYGAGAVHVSERHKTSGGKN